MRQLAEVAGWAFYQDYLVPVLSSLPGHRLLFLRPLASSLLFLLSQALPGALCGKSVSVFLTTRLLPIWLVLVRTCWVSFHSCLCLKR